MMLRLTTFGAVAVQATGEGGSIEERRLPRRALALLVLVAAGPSTGASRDSIIGRLWPETDHDHARSALRQTLFTIRHDLDGPDLILGGPDLVLNPAVMASDVRELQIARAAGDLLQVVDLHVGPFLEGFHLDGSAEFEQWADRKRAEYGAWAAAAMEALARAANSRRDPAAAAEWWGRLAATDPLNTRFTVELVMAHAACGNTAGALRQAQVHQDLLRDELGAAPNRTLDELVGQIRKGGSLPLRPGPVEPIPPQPPAARSERGQPEPFDDRLAGALADRYVIEGGAEMGREGGIRLFRARDRRYDRPVTLKVLHPALASQMDIERFVREIRLTGRLLHPHILPLLDSGEVDGRPWFVTPLAEGETLRARLGREVSVSLQEALRLVLELSDALGHAHAHAVVHRNVSPENVFLAGGHALLTNLGVARALDTAAAATLTDTGVLLGSPAYMSPEQTEGAHGVDGRSDIYALGAVMFEMVSGEPLFSGPTPEAILAKRAAQPTPDSARLGALPSAVRGVLKRALDRRPERRYASMALFGSALTEAVSGESWSRGFGRAILTWTGRFRN
jgi:DNA-binding SARP family transcriptional activator